MPRLHSVLTARESHLGNARRQVQRLHRMARQLDVADGKASVGQLGINDPYGLGEVSVLARVTSQADQGQLDFRMPIDSGVRVSSNDAQR